MNPDLFHVLEGASWPALLVDVGGKILHANEAAVKAFGPAMEGPQRDIASIWSPENGTSAEQFLNQWESSSSAAFPLKYRVAGGGVSHYLTAVCEFPEGADNRFILQLLPHTPPPAQRTGALDANSVHKQKLDCALQMARSVSLDFNNALTSVLGYTSLLLSKAEPDHPWRVPLVEMEKAAAKAAEIAADLAAFSRQEKESRGQQTGNLNAILQRCAESFQQSHKGRVEWQFQLERRLFSAKFDEAKMQQAFLKIIENSLEALKDGGHITIQTRNMQLAEPTQDRNARLAAGPYVCAEITDNGAGIEADLLARVFEPFFTTKSAPHRGLGLAWVYGIVTNHGGGVAVSSRTGEGTSVRVYLPAEEAIVRENTEFFYDLRGSQTILLVDDEDLLLTMGETILTSYGYKVLTANTGQKALEIASKPDVQIDLLLTDLVMPSMSGRELVERFQQVSPSTRIICTSGYAMPASRQDADAFLQKPFTSQELLLKVKQSLMQEAAQVD
jgi:two-component system, cell cycle sensor histidine kinase and response regulator CckA